MELTKPYRVSSIDILRGIVMIIMALDHTRDFFHVTAFSADPLNPATTTPALYLTRWITHFCAPTFVFLSGISAFLASRKKSRNEASLFLIKRGFWLIFVEVVVITFGLTFNPFFNIIILQVIWAIGTSMIILGLLSRLSYKAVLATGLVLFFGHNLADYLHPDPNSGAAVFLTVFLSSRGTLVPAGDNAHFIGVFYTILPWTGVMMVGYAIGPLFQAGFDVAKRRRILLGSGTGLTLLFIMLRLVNHYGDPRPWKHYDTFLQNLLSFLNASKYPPSLLYVCMTLGPALMILSGLEKTRSKLASVASVYGKVPFFYYVLHFYLLHLILVVLFFASGYTTRQVADPNIPFLFRPAAFGYELPVVYLIWACAVAALYGPCRWFGRYKERNRKWWLSYL
ncbi:DUF1624 domain-containing protein [Hufsiella ginkgonis]|uniref:DUF1624 domain-containing protein n=1 Tax=Hufsiella ginkgonis TaxID=2695274 RepID=A0A7K1XTC8_9SPHI|nr:heparan-alpha-glucosaminide N-acetyltransferase domain-containing protein [Hufsiella ginkgonis]MXV14180.1 DUF1624 domain-containing protein [Hufsiella ginkgonis]